MSFSKLQSCICLLIISALFAGCSDSSSEALNVGAIFPAFTVYDLSGDEVVIASQFTAKTRLISIRTLGCRFCKSDFAELEKLYQYYTRDELNIFVITVGFEKKSVEDFLQDKTVSFELLIDETMQSMKSTKSTILPVVYLVDSDNIIIARIQGGFSFEEIKHDMDSYE